MGAWLSRSRFGAGALVCFPCGRVRYLLQCVSSCFACLMDACCTTPCRPTPPRPRPAARPLTTAQLCGACDQLAQFGPMKAPDAQGLDHVEDDTGDAALVDVKKGERSSNYAADPLGARTGNAPDAKVAEVLRKTCEDARAYVNTAHVQRRDPQRLGDLQEKLDHIRGAVMIAFPMGLPAYDTVRSLIESDDEVQGYLDPASCRLWWAGKEFMRDTSVGDRVGRNEKTKVICRLQGAKGGAPSREPAVSEDERKSMMAHYFKKQEEMKKLAENDDDEFHNTTWASSSQLKSSLGGIGSIRAPGIM